MTLTAEEQPRIQAEGAGNWAQKRAKRHNYNVASHAAFKSEHQRQKINDASGMCV